MQGAGLIERHHPDLAIEDLGLPLMSGYGQDSDIQAALDAGFDEHLTKPPDPEQLEQVLAAARADGANGPRIVPWR